MHECDGGRAECVCKGCGAAAVEAEIPENNVALTTIVVVVVVISERVITASSAPPRQF
jgi:hypothetical protein